MNVYVDELPNCCGHCKFCMKETIYDSELTDYRITHYCLLTEYNVSVFISDGREDNCKLILLKPKELVWFYDGETYKAKMFGDIEISFDQFINGKSTIYIASTKFDEYENKTNSELKQICNEIYNKLFKEMIGMLNENLSSKIKTL